MAATIVNPRIFRNGNTVLMNSLIDNQPYLYPVKDLYIQNDNIHLGTGAGGIGVTSYIYQGTGSVAIGGYASQNYQGNFSVSVGYEAAQQNQGDYSVAIGYDAGQNNQGTGSIAIGAYAGQQDQVENSIIINASNSSFNNSTGGFFVKPINRNENYDDFKMLRYNETSGEIIYSYPIAGVISMYGGTAAPMGHLFCNGTEVSRTTYSRLFDVIGTIYGSGNGTGTFNLPNLQGRVPVGLKSTETLFNTLGNIGGTGAHTLSVSEIPAHTHTYLGVTGQGVLGGATDTAADEANRPTETSGSTGGGQAHNNLQPYIVLNYIISY